MSEKMELKRCPCCNTISAFEEGVIGYFVACQSQKCSCRSGIFPTKPMARNAWNTRASSPAQEPVTAEPVAWRWKVHGIWHYAGGFPVSGAEPLYAIPAPPQPGREEVAWRHGIWHYPGPEEIKQALQAAWDNSRDGFEIDKMVDAILALTGEPK